MEDPVSFAREGAPPRLIDEVHRGGDWLIRAIKMTVDEDPRPGQFVLSGSSRFLTVPTLSESLAGRAVFIALWPLSAAERTHGSTDFLARVFDEPSALVGRDSTWTRDVYIDVIIDGGFPEVLPSPATSPEEPGTTATSPPSSTVISANSRRDKAQAIPRLLSLVAIRSGSTLVLTDIARSADLSRNTARDYLTYLDIVFLTAEVSPWSTNLTSRLSKTPKVYLTDSGLAAHLLGVSAADLRRTGHPALGGSVVGIEVKSSASPGTDAARHLRWR